VLTGEFVQVSLVRIQRVNLLSYDQPYFVPFFRALSGALSRAFVLAIW